MDSPPKGFLLTSMLSGSIGWLWLAQAPESMNGLIRVLRFKGASTSDIIWFCIALSTGLLGLFILAFVHGRVTDKGPFKRRPPPPVDPLVAKGLDEQEQDIFKEVVVLADSTVEACLEEVASFDRGVDRLLVHATLAEPDFKLEQLRMVRALRRKLGFDSQKPGEPLHSTHCLSTDQEILVSLLDEDGEAVSTHVTTVFFNEEEGLLLRLLPTEEQAHKEPFSGETTNKLRAFFFRYNEGSYEFETSLVEFRNRGPGFLRLKHARSLRRLQRRNYPRVEVDEFVDFRWIPNNDSSENKKALYKDPTDEGEVKGGRILDLSGGGAKLEISKTPLSVDDWVEIRFPFLPNPMSSIKTFCRVVHIYESSGDKKVCGIQFESPQARLELALLKEVDRRMSLQGELESQEA